MSLAVLFHFLCAQHVADINISIIRSLRLCCWITTSVFCSRFVVCWRFGVVGFEKCPCCRLKLCFSLQHGHYSNPAAPNLQHTMNREQKTHMVIQQHSRKLLIKDILMSETRWVHKKRNKIASDIKLVLYSSTITMMHGPINIRKKLVKFIKYLIGQMKEECRLCTGTKHNSNLTFSS